MVDLMLQAIAHTQPSHFQDSFAQKATLSMLNIPPNAWLFTTDAKSFHTNIQTGPTLHYVSQLLHQEED